MTRAKYIAETNELQELPGMEAPRPPFDGMFSEYWDIHRMKMAAYNKAVAKCRTIPCSPECRGLWKPGQEYEEGRDYEVRGAGEWKWCYQLKGKIFAAPIVAVRSEAPFIWTDELVKEYAEQYRFSSSRISIEQFKYSLTKR